VLTENNAACRADIEEYDLDSLNWTGAGSFSKTASRSPACGNGYIFQFRAEPQRRGEPSEITPSLRLGVSAGK